MKKILSLLLALLLIFSLTGCLSSQIPELSKPDIDVYFPTSSADSTEASQLPTQMTPEVSEPEQSEPPATQPKPTEPAPTQPKPTEPKPTQPKPTEPKPTEPKPTEPTVPALDPNGSYDSKEDVALYLHLYGELPPNYITKTEARRLGWTGGSLERYAPGKCIGGDKFSNREGLLPKASGRVYYECDIGTLGASSRGARRIVFSNDGLIYYTSDHYKSFTLLYGEE